MSNADTIAALYDHEREHPFGDDRRRRDAHDWGADDLFDGTSYRGRRFQPGGHQLPQREVADWFEDETPNQLAVADSHFDAGAGRDDRYDGRHDRYDGRDDRYDGRDDGRDDRHDGRADRYDGRADDPRFADAVSTTAPTLELDLPIGVARPARRTVAITGHPDAIRRAERAVELHHRRPGRSLDDRIAHRPEMIAAYACGLGVLLILIAVLTASQ